MAITRGMRHKRKNIASKSCGDVPERKNSHIRIIPKKMWSPNDYELMTLSKTTKKCFYLRSGPSLFEKK